MIVKDAAFYERDLKFHEEVAKERRAVLIYSVRRSLQMDNRVDNPLHCAKEIGDCPENPLLWMLLTTNRP